MSDFDQAEAQNKIVAVTALIMHRPETAIRRLFDQKRINLVFGEDAMFVAFRHGLPTQPSTGSKPGDDRDAGYLAEFIATWLQRLRDPFTYETIEKSGQGINAPIDWNGQHLPLGSDTAEQCAGTAYYEFPLRVTAALQDLNMGDREAMRDLRLTKFPAKHPGQAL